MEGPPISLHVQEESKSVRAFTPAPVAFHWQEKVKAELDVDLGVLRACALW